ncbi:MAG: sugar transferase [Chloroflexota bacterium]|nr:sugar transferase [Chloroflexota bacterium]
MPQISPSALAENEPASSPYVSNDAGRRPLRVLAPQPPMRLGLDVLARTWAVKRAMDIVIAAVALVCLAPVFAIIAVAIKFDSPGSVLFRQERIGRYGRPFQMLKFRTMIADRRKQTLGVPPDAEDRRRAHKTPHDPRITRLGRFLRRSCLDEIPQLWNVLRGEMSLVGPRPELPEIVARYESWQHQRHAVTPGLTGWWQVNRDGRRLMHESTELDLYYLEHWSVGLDLVILFRTLLIVMRGVGAF